MPIGPGSESPLARSSASLRHTSYPPQNRGVRLSESAASMVAIFARTAGSRNRSATRATIWCPSSAHASTDRGSRAIKQTTSENTTRRTVETRAGSLNDRDVLALGFVRVRNLSNELTFRSTSRRWDPSGSSHPLFALPISRRTEQTRRIPERCGGSFHRNRGPIFQASTPVFWQSDGTRHRRLPCRTIQRTIRLKSDARRQFNRAAPTRDGDRRSVCPAEPIRIRPTPRPDRDRPSGARATRETA